MFMIVRSRTTISCAMPITPRISQRRRPRLLPMVVASDMTVATSLLIVLRAAQIAFESQAGLRSGEWSSPDPRDLHITRIGKQPLTAMAASVGRPTLFKKGVADDDEAIRTGAAICYPTILIGVRDSPAAIGPNDQGRRHRRFRGGPSAVGIQPRHHSRRDAMGRRRQRPALCFRHRAHFHAGTFPRRR